MGAFILVYGPNLDQLLTLNLSIAANISCVLKLIAHIVDASI